MDKCDKDYCSLWFEGTWCKCCKLHDRRYANKRLTKLQADILLYRCVKRKSNRCMASLMFIGVSLGGWYAYYIKN
jgi:hypothetical protein